MTGISRAARNAQAPDQGKGGYAGRWPRLCPTLRQRLIHAAALLACVTVFAPVLAAPAHAAPQNNGVGSQFELLYWQSVAASDDPGQLEAYLAQYPNGTFAALARAKIAMLTKRPPAPVAPPTPVTPSPVTPTVAPPAVAPDPAPPVVPPPVTPQPVYPQPVAPQPAPQPQRAPEPQQSPVPEPHPVPAPQPGVLPDPVAIIMGTAVAPVPVVQSDVALPPRPQFRPLPPVNLPAQFCTAMDRNDFYDAVYRPSKDVADQNNQTAITHMRGLQGLYDSLGQHGDMAAQNIVSAEARAYQPVAAGAYQASLAYDGLFNRLMAVPIVPCGGAQQP